MMSEELEAIQREIENGTLLETFDIPLGTGGARTAFTSKAFPDLVAKSLYWPLASTNAKEWANWHKINADAPDLVRWFAPCIAYDAKRDVLVMKRTSPIPSRRWPLFMPTCFDTDKKENFGLYEGHFVCHDYATITLDTHGSPGWHQDLPPARGWRRAPWPGMRAGMPLDWCDRALQMQMTFFDDYFDRYHARLAALDE